MPKPKCSIQIAAESVDVVTDGLFGTRTSRLWFGWFMIALLVCSVYLAVFHPGRGPAVLDTLAETRPGRPHFVSNLIVLAYFSLFELFLLAVGIRHLLPFGEHLHANRSDLTWSRIPWLSFGNRWVTKSTPLPEISRASYTIVYKSKGTYGILLETYGESWKMFWGIEAPEANRILRGLNALGVNVHHDPEMRESIRETLRDRRAQL